MSKSVTKEILGFTVTFGGIAETLSELVTLAGSEERVVDLVNSQVLAHSTFGKARKVIVAKLEELTQIKRKTNDDGEYTESEQQFVARLEEELGEGSLTQYDSAIAEAASAVTTGYVATEREAGTGGKIAKRYLAIFDDLVAKNKLENFAAKHKIKLGVGPEVDKAVVCAKIREIINEAEKAAAQAAGDV
jgi:hypothetical protein